MKQHITESQFNELSEKGKKSFNEWIDKDTDTKMKGMSYFIDSSDSAVLLSIGKMIEFLTEKSYSRMMLELNSTKTQWRILDQNDELTTKTREGKPQDELCDALFESVKEILEK